MMKKQNPFQLFPRDVLLIIAKKLADKDLGALRCDRWLDERLSPAFHRRVRDSLTVKAIAAGSYHSFVLMSNGQLLACGDNTYGQLGLGDKESRNKWTPIGGINDSIGQIATGGRHIVVLMQKGRLFTCGTNNFGQLGLGESDDRDTLTPIKGLKAPVRWVTVGSYHTIVCTLEGRLLACGSNRYGQLGLGDSQDQHRLTPIDDLTEPIAQAAVGFGHSVMLTTSGHVFACGSNGYGQLGVGYTVNRETWVRLEGINEPVKQVVAGGYHTLVLLMNGRLMVCGYNDSGQLGLNESEGRDTLTPVLGLPELKCVEAGDAHSLVITKSGQCFACGYNGFGQLGLGDQKNRRVFACVQGLTEPLTQVCAGGQHTLAITQRGQLLVCGMNNCGQLGLGDKKDRKKNCRPFNFTRRVFYSIGRH